MLMSRFMHVFFSILLFRVALSIYSSRYFLPTFLNSPFHNSKILFLVDSFHDFSLGFVGDIGYFFNLWILRGLTFNARVNAISGARRLIRHYEKKVRILIGLAVEGRSVLRNIIVDIVPVDWVEAWEIQVEGVIIIVHV